LGQPSVAAGTLASRSPLAGSFGGDRLAEIDTLLRSPEPDPVQPQVVAVTPPPANVLAAPAVAAVTGALAGTVTATPHKRYWVQLASGANPAALPPLMRGIRSRSEDLLNGVSAYIAEEPGKARLLVGPFRNASDAEVFAEDLETLRVDAFRWISPEGQPIRKLTSE
jgi:hypothetical protein